MTQVSDGVSDFRTHRSRVAAVHQNLTFRESTPMGSRQNDDHEGVDLVQMKTTPPAVAPVTPILPTAVQPPEAAGTDPRVRSKRLVRFKRKQRGQQLHRLHQFCRPTVRPPEACRDRPLGTITAVVAVQTNTTPPAVAPAAPILPTYRSAARGLQEQTLGYDQSG
jgi:hypothetical protein